jgi:hypothetical protein
MREANETPFLIAAGHAMWLAILFVIVGIGLVLAFAGLVKGTVGLARGFGISAFMVSVVFLGFAPEDLAVGAVGAYDRHDRRLGHNRVLPPRRCGDDRADLDFPALPSTPSLGWGLAGGGMPASQSAATCSTARRRVEPAIDRRAFR